MTLEVNLIWGILIIELLAVILKSKEKGMHGSIFVIYATYIGLIKKVVYYSWWLFLCRGLYYVWLIRNYSAEKHNLSGQRLFDVE